MVNVKRHGDGAAVWRVASPNEQIAPVVDDGISAVVLKVEQGLAEVVSEALDARIDDEGRVTFSLAGVGGFHVEASESGLSFGRGDTMLAFNGGGGTQVERRVAALDAIRAAEGQEGQAAPSDSNPLRELLALALRALQYPLFWVLVLLALAGKIALVIARAQGRRRSHRLRSVSEPQKIKRSRTRLRLKRVRTRIRLQQST